MGWRWKRSHGPHRGRAHYRSHWKGNINRLEWSLRSYSILLWRVFLDDHIDELISVLVDELDALFVDRGGQAVAKDVKSLLDLRLVGLVLQKRKNS